MRCPKCRCEVGSQKMCPYCGTPMETPEQRIYVQGAESLNKMNRSIRGLDSAVKEESRKLNILLVVSCGNLVLTLLVLIAWAIS